MMPTDDPRLPGSMPSPLVGREREEAMLRGHLAAALGGHGSLVLIGGEAGIGKTALAEALCREAASQGTLVLTGRCYDLTETPPYGPWVDLLRQYPPADDRPVLSSLFAGGGTVSSVGNQAGLFEQVRDFLGAVAATRPLVLLLDDLHWADPASLDLLRYLARCAATLPILLIVTYRADKLTRLHPLYRLLPLLEREARTIRLDLRPLPDDAIRALVGAHYRLSEPDAARLTAHLHTRAEGNAFFTTELLRALEEEDLLRRAETGWQLGDLTDVQVPMPLRQVIDSRLVRLGEEAQTLLEVAAVIGQDVPLDVWAAASGADEETLSAIIEQAVAARLMDETPDGTSAHFVHALIRETLYEGILPSRRRRMHREVGETLTEQGTPDPDAVAYHFRQAGDARTSEWLVKAGERAQRAYAWLTAADRYEAALRLMEGQRTRAGRRGWLLFRLALMRRFVAPESGISYLEEAQRLAAEDNDHCLFACALFCLGWLRCLANDNRRGITEMEAGVAAIEALIPDDRHRLESLQETAGIVIGTGRGTLAGHLGIVGRHHDAIALGEIVLAEATSSVESDGLDSAFCHADAAAGLMRAYAALGRPDEARDAFIRARDLYRAVEHYRSLGVIVLQYFTSVVLPYAADDLVERGRILAGAEHALARSSGMIQDVSTPRSVRLPLLLLEGKWSEIPDLAPALEAASGGYRAVATSVLGQLAYRQGNMAQIARLVRAVLPAGPSTLPGAGHFSEATKLQRIMALALADSGDLSTMRAWLEAHDRWLAWGGPVLGQAEGRLIWAMYHRAAGEQECAYQDAIQALALASEPRQPLALLAAHRLLGELETDAEGYPEAASHLDAALALSDACAAPYERALSMLAQAEMRAASGCRAEAVALLVEVRAICTPLGARPALARVDALIASFAATAAPAPAYPDRLTEREVVVLRHIAEGMSNREIAGALSVSVRTIERHIENLYRKINAHSKAEATAYAFRHNLA